MEGVGRRDKIPGAETGNKASSGRFRVIKLPEWKALELSIYEFTEELIWWRWGGDSV